MIGRELEAAFVGAPDEAILALEARLRRAQLDADVAALDVLIAWRVVGGHVSEVR